MRIALALLACTGCGIGAGSAFVGQWRPRTDHAYVACLEDEQGRCVDQKTVDVQVPARRFFGYMVMVSTGAAIVDKSDRSDTRLRIEMLNEFVRGHGRLAWGVRASALIDIGQHASVNLMGLGYYSLTERLTLRAGLGYSPFTRTEGEMSEDAFLGGRALAGMQFALSRVQSENFIILSLDVDRMYIAFDDPVAVTGIVGNLGIFF